MTADARPPRAIGISGSTSSNSRSRALVASTLAQLAQRGVDSGEIINLHTLPADALLARRKDDAVDAAIAQVLAADIVVLGTPVYRAAYTGQLKAFLDLFPQDALLNRVIGLTATGAGPGHALTIDHTLRPLVASLRGLAAASSLYITDAQFPDKNTLPPAVDDLASALAGELATLAQGLRHAKVQVG